MVYYLVMIYDIMSGEDNVITIYHIIPYLLCSHLWAVVVLVEDTSKFYARANIVRFYLAYFCWLYWYLSS